MGTERLFADLQLDAGRPIYQQIIEAVRRAMARGDLLAGDKLPSQRELAQQLQVNPNTIQHAYRELEYMDMTRTARGQGTFVAEYGGLNELKAELAREAVRDCLQTLRQLGLPDDAVLRHLEAELRDTGRPERDGRAQEASDDD